MKKMRAGVGMWEEAYFFLPARRQAGIFLCFVSFHLRKRNESPSDRTTCPAGQPVRQDTWGLGRSPKKNRQPSTDSVIQ